MKFGPIGHGALLAAALGLGWQTWTRDPEIAPSTATLVLWPEDGAVQSLTLHGERRELAIERRSSEGASYLWAKFTKTTPPPPSPPGAADAGPGASASQPASAVTTTSEFPVGEDGEKAIARLAPLKALRDLGPLSDEKKDEYGLGATSERLSVKGRGERELILGGRVFGGDDRYVLDGASQRVYVVAGEIVRPFDSGEYALRERRLHGFDLNAVARVILKASDHERAVVRTTKSEVESLPGRPAPPPTWADAATPDLPDQTLANFMERFEQLTPTDYSQTVDPATLTAVARLEYRGRDGSVLGSVELTKKAATAPGSFEYYVKSERTRGLAKVNPMAAGRVDADLAQIFK